jgi:tetratricopeptide (TPR) repeat protein
MSYHITELEARLAQAQMVQEKIDVLNDLAWELRNADKARALLLSQQASELARSGEFAAHPYLPGVAASLRIPALDHVRNGQFKLAAAQCKQVLSILDSAPNAAHSTDILTILARAHWGLGNYADALDYGHQALKYARQINDQNREAYALDAVAVIHNYTHKFELAISAQQEALQLYQSTGNKSDETLVLNNMADTYLNAGQLDEALSAGLESLRLAKANGVSQIVMAANGTIGEIYLARDEYELAAAYLHEALRLSQQLGNQHLELAHHMNLGLIARARHDSVLALTYLHQALAIAQEIGERIMQARCYEQLAETYAQQGDSKKAIENYRQFHITQEAVFSEKSSHKLAELQSKYEAELAKRDADILRMKAVQLQAEIEERKRTEEALRESESKQRLILETVQAGIVIIDPQTHVIDRRNKRANRWDYLPPEHLPGGGRSLSHHRPASDHGSL